jgi:hypothetical protein
MPRKLRPHLRLEMAELGRVDPFLLAVEERPPGSGKFQVHAREGGDGIPVERAGLSLVGASQALFKLSFEWLQQVGGDAPEPGPVMGEMRLAVRRKEARLMAALLRRHLGRLPEPPEWMSDLMRALDEMDEFLRWQE